MCGGILWWEFNLTEFGCFLDYRDPTIVLFSVRFLASELKSFSSAVAPVRYGLLFAEFISLLKTNKPRCIPREYNYKKRLKTKPNLRIKISDESLVASGKLNELKCDVIYLE